MTHSPHHLQTRGRLALALVGTLALGACSMEFKGQPTEFQLSPQTLEILTGDEEAQAALERELTRLFGTQALPQLQGDAQTLAAGAKLYAAKCLHCHGNEGGGDGITSRSVKPVPRDFRMGIFKFDNIANGARPELSDLAHVIRTGINGTAMPSMQSLADGDIAELARYVRYIAMRGEVENWLVEEYEPGLAITQHLAQTAYEEVRALWLEADRERYVAPSPVPPATEDSIRAGFALFHDPRGANCAGCHGAGGSERGPSAWNTTPLSPDEKVALLRDAWGHDSIPRLLDSEIFRHGTDPQNLFERIYLGIDGTPMAGIGETLGTDGQRQFSEANIWSLVHYVSALNAGSWTELTGGLAGELEK